MKTNFTLLLFALAVIFTACKNEPCCDKEQEKINSEQELKAVSNVLEKYVIAQESQDLEQVQSVWAPDGDIVIFGTAGDEKLVGWEEIKNAFKTQYDLFDEVFITVKDQNIKMSKKCHTAWFSETIDYSYTANDEAKTYEGIRFTGVLEKRDGKWYIVQSHMSIPAAE